MVSPSPARTIVRYRNLLRRIRRLPFDQTTLSHAREKLRAAFQSKKFRSKSAHTIQSYIDTFDSLLVHERYSNIPQILDLIYKRLEPVPEWVRVYRAMPFDEIVARIPQRHLIEEFSQDDAIISNYHKKIKERRKNIDGITWGADFLEDIARVKREIELSDNPDALAPLKRKGSEDGPTTTPENSSQSQADDSAMETLLKTHAFLVQNQSSLTHYKLKPLEILYPINAFGAPLPLNRVKKLQREVVADASNVLFEKLPPIKKDYLFTLYESVISASKTAVNPAFFRWIQRKRAREAEETGPISPVRRKYILQRVAMPTANTIRKKVREYVQVQYYWDPEQGSYSLSPLKDFYETDQAKISSDYELPEQ